MLLGALQGLPCRLPVRLASWVKDLGGDGEGVRPSMAPNVGPHGQRATRDVCMAFCQSLTSHANLSKNAVYLPPDERPLRLLHRLTLSLGSP